MWPSKKNQIHSKHEKHCHEDRATITNYAHRVSMTVPWLHLSMMNHARSMNHSSIEFDANIMNHACCMVCARVICKFHASCAHNQSCAWNDFMQTAWIIPVAVSFVFSLITCQIMKHSRTMNHAPVMTSCKHHEPCKRQFNVHGRNGSTCCWIKNISWTIHVWWVIRKSWFHANTFIKSNVSQETRTNHDFKKRKRTYSVAWRMCGSAKVPTA